jgi:hypothetical protein
MPRSVLSKSSCGLYPCKESANSHPGSRVQMAKGTWPIWFSTDCQKVPTRRKNSKLTWECFSTGALRDNNGYIDRTKLRGKGQIENAIFFRGWASTPKNLRGIARALHQDSE